MDEQSACAACSRVQSPEHGKVQQYISMHFFAGIDVAFGLVPLPNLDNAS
jgi:hypothetical protein